MTPTEYVGFGDPVSISSGSMAALQATVMGLGPGCLEPRNLMPVRWTFLVGLYIPHLPLHSKSTPAYTPFLIFIAI
jgi:hypothetical protein